MDVNEKCKNVNKIATTRSCFSGVSEKYFRSS